MFLITPENVEQYTQCPRRAFNSWNIPREISPVTKLVENIIQSCYIHLARKKEPASWRLVLSWTERKYAEVISSLSTQEDYEKIKGILVKLSNWYGKYYTGEYNVTGLTNVPISLNIGQGCIFQDYIPVLTADIKILDFYYKEASRTKNTLYYNSLTLYNDIKVQARLWGLRQYIGETPTGYIRFLMEGNKAIKPIKITPTKETLEKQDRLMRQVLQGIKDKVFYPSYSDQCTTCPYMKGCSF